MSSTSWAWQGQRPADWPRWLWAKNVAIAGDKLIIHTADGSITVEPGDTIENGEGRQVYVRKSLLSEDVEVFKRLRDSF